MKNIIEITSPEEYKKAVKQINRKMILKFTSKNCPPCVKLDKTIDCCEYDRDVDILNIKTDVCYEIARSYGITATPTILVINRRGEEKTRKMGYMKTETWKTFLNEEYYSYEESNENEIEDEEDVHDKDPYEQKKGMFSNAIQKNEEKKDESMKNEQKEKGESVKDKQGEKDESMNDEQDKKDESMKDEQEKKDENVKDKEEKKDKEDEHESVKNKEAEHKSKTIKKD
ncbi:hypothetical protein BDAP_001230 [Binucleata daphniae]